MVNIVGDRSAGKTFVALSLCAEACIRSEFDAFRLIHDDVEHASEFDLERLFGPAMAERVEAPVEEDGEPLPSSDIEDFLVNMDSVLEDGRPFIYILDALDALSSQEEREHTEDVIEARKKGKEISGSYGTAKAKALSGILRQVAEKVDASNGLLVILSQVREKIGVSFGSKLYRAGGRALGHYCTHEVWLAHIEQIKRQVRGQSRMTGMKCRAKVTKNKLTGKLRDADFSIYHSYGIDDIRSCVQFLVDTKHWTKGKNVNAVELGLAAPMESLIRKIEMQSLEEEMRAVVGQVWAEIEEKCSLRRKPKYKRGED